MKKIVILFLLMAPIIAFAQDRKGTPAKSKTSAPFSANMAISYEYATMTVIDGENEKMCQVEIFDADKNEMVSVGKYRLLMEALHGLGQKGYQVVDIDDKGIVDGASKKVFLLMRVKPRTR